MSPRSAGRADRAPMSKRSIVGASMQEDLEASRSIVEARRVLAPLTMLSTLLLGLHPGAVGWRVARPGITQSIGCQLLRMRGIVRMEDGQKCPVTSTLDLDEANDAEKRDLIIVDSKPGPGFWEAFLGIGLNGNPWEYMLAMRGQGYGGVTKVPLGPFGGDYYFLLQPPALQQALLNDAREFYPNRFSVDLFQLLELNRGIVYEKGTRHKRQKGLCIPSFENKQSMLVFFNAVQEETDNLTSTWQSRASDSGSVRLDLFRETKRLTLAVILRVTFGLGEAGRDFNESAALSETIGQYLEAIVSTANEVPPLWSISPALSPNYRAVTETLLPELRRLVAAVIAERRERDGEELSRGVVSNRADLLSVLIKDETMTDKDIEYVLLDLVIAGSDTTAGIIAAAIFILHEPNNAAALAALRSEVLRINITSLTYEEVYKQLPYATAVAKEVLRLYPAVPFIGRTAVKNGTVLDAEVPEGGTLCFSPYCLGRDPASWGADAGEFRPQRWVDDPKKGGASSPLSWLPFGAGPRGCVGRSLGLVEAAIGIALIVQRFDFAFDGAGGGLKYKYDLTLNLEGTTLCTATMRSQ